jgi:hypothetical protein
LATAAVTKTATTNNKKILILLIAISFRGEKHRRDNPLVLEPWEAQDSTHFRLPRNEKADIKIRDITKMSNRPEDGSVDGRKWIKLKR